MLRSLIILLVALLIGVSIGFFVGVQYKSNQVKTAFANAMKNPTPGGGGSLKDLYNLLK